MTHGRNDLFPSFSERQLDASGAELFARIGGRGPPLLLLHGYPQTRVCWHLVEITEIDGVRIRVRSLEALNGTPIIDVKPVLSENVDER